MCQAICSGTTEGEGSGTEGETTPPQTTCYTGCIAEPGNTQEGCTEWCTNGSE
jgi:hypothetical protein